MVNRANLGATLGLDQAPFDKGLAKARGSVSKFGKQTQTTLGETGRHFSQFTSTAGRTSGVISSLKQNLGSLAGVAATALSGRQIIRYSDTYKNLQGRLSIVTKGTEEMAAVTENLFQIAQNTRTPLEAVSNLYIRLSQSLTEAQRETTNVSGVTDTFSKALAITGESAASAQGAILQFTQAVAGDFKSAGQELGSIIEQAPRVAQALAAGLGTTVGGLKELAKSGQITRDQVLAILDPLSEQGQKIAAEFGKIPVTVAKAFTTLDNAILKYVGLSELADSGTGALATAIQGIANNFEELANVLLTVGAAFALPAIGSLAASFAAATVAQVNFIGAAVNGNGVLLASDRATIKLAQSNVALARSEVANISNLVAKQQQRIADIRTLELTSASTLKLAAAQRKLDALTTRGVAAAKNLAVAQTGVTTATAGAAKGMRAFGTALTGAFKSPLGLFAIITALQLLEEETGILSDGFNALGEAYKDLLRVFGVTFNADDVFNNIIQETEAGVSDLRAKIEGLKSVDLALGSDSSALIDEETEKLNRQLKVLENIRKQKEGGAAADEEASGGAPGSSRSASSKRDPFKESIRSLELQEELLRKNIELFGASDAELEKALDNIRIRNSLEKEGIVLGKTQSDLLNERLDGISKESQKLEELEAQKEEIQELEDKRREAIEDYANAFESSFEDAIVGGEKLRDVLQGLLEDLLKIALRSAITRPLADGIGSIFSGGSQGSPFSGISSLFASFDVGSDSVPNDMLANVHKGEMIIPASEAAAIRRGGLSGGGGSVVVNVTNNAGASVNTTSSETSNGTSVEVMIDQAVADNIGKRGSRTNASLKGFSSQSIRRR